MKKISVFIMILTVLLIPANVFASGGGNGTGGGKSESLYVESASIEDGGVLSPDEAITLVFSKNVVNSKVSETNTSLFTVQDGNDTEVAIEVVMADDQVEPNKKNDVVIRFPEGLADGTYTLTAKQGITSKSGDVMEKDYTLTFQAGGAQTSEQSSEQAPETSTEQTEAPTSEQTSKQALDQPSEQETTQAPETTAASETEGKNIMPVIIIVVVLAAAGGFMILRKKK